MAGQVEARPGVAKKEGANQMTKSMASFKNYNWRAGGHAPKAWAPVFGERVDWLQKQLGHAPKASDILEDARDEASPTHHMFNWDDAEAAEKYRRIQSSLLLSALVVKVEIMSGGKMREMEMPVRVVINYNRKEGSSHEHIQDVLDDPDMREKMFKIAAEELVSIQRRFSYVKELDRVFKEVDRVAKRTLPHKK